MDVAPVPKLPTVRSAEDVSRRAGGRVAVEGVYEQQDVRMMPVNPDTLFEGHVALVLDDGTQVFLYPPYEEQARRGPEEIRRFEHKRVRVTGLLYPTIPPVGATLMAPCLVDIGSIEETDAVAS